jgi:hypothetical protein
MDLWKRDKGLSLCTKPGTLEKLKPQGRGADKKMNLLIFNTGKRNFLKINVYLNYSLACLKFAFTSPAKYR